jgi:hypothetical protein
MEILADPPLRFQNIYRIAAPRGDARILHWQSENPALGTLKGVFFVADDTILSAFQSSDGGSLGSEAIRQLAPDRYEAHGLFLAAGAVVSSWSMELIREA